MTSVCRTSRSSSMAIRRGRSTFRDGRGDNESGDRRGLGRARQGTSGMIRRPHPHPCHPARSAHPSARGRSAATSGVQGGRTTPQPWTPARSRGDNEMRTASAGIDAIWASRHRERGTTRQPPPPPLSPRTERSDDPGSRAAALRRCPGPRLWGRDDNEMRTASTGIDAIWAEHRQEAAPDPGHESKRHEKAQYHL